MLLIIIAILIIARCNNIRTIFMQLIRIVFGKSPVDIEKHAP